MQTPFHGDVNALTLELKKTNKLLADLVRSRTDWKIALRQALWTGFGGLIGATILVSILLTLLKPLGGLRGLKPTLDELYRQLKRGAQ